MKSVRKVPARRLKNNTLVLIVTGSIAAYKVADLIQVLREGGARVIPVLTEAAKKFVTPLTLRAVAGEPVYDDLFTAHSPYDVIHTSLADLADLILIAPASANFIARMAMGFANDLATSIILAANCPVLLAPAMNDRMYLNAVTQENIKKLKGLGYEFVEPVEGHLICGREALGHVADPEQIADQAAQILASSPRRGSSSQ